MNAKIFTEATERREASRFAREEEGEVVELRVNGEIVRAELVEESLGGIRVLAPARECLSIGQKLELRFALGVASGVVRHAAPRAGGVVLLGIECEPSGSA